jgi:hypothetical protein
MRYRRSLPVVDVRLTASPEAQVIADHLAMRDGRRWRYRRAQGVLRLPAEFAEYIRGRRRQAVRTNVGHARKAGYTVRSFREEDWVPGLGDDRVGHLEPGPIERWQVFDAEGGVVADSVLSIDREVALLHGLVSWAPDARWLLHTAIVEHLCGNCRVLLANTEEIYLLPAGNRHFARLLGYEVASLHVTRDPLPEALSLPAEPAGLVLPPGPLSPDSSL